MRALKILISTTALAAGLALAPKVSAQVFVEVGIQPTCEYGYYDYQPYACAPYGFYGPGYFYDGIFLGMGPWAGWGYGHGWGRHRFIEAGGGSYHGRGGEMANRGHYAGGGQGRPGGGRMRGNQPASHAGGARPNAGRPAQRSSAPRGGAPHGSSGPAVSHGGGGGRPAGGGGRPGGHEGGEHE